MNINHRALFVTSCFALILTSMTFAFRASLESVWSQEFNLTKEQIGWIFSPAFWGFTLSMIIGGPLCDILGAKRLLFVALFAHVLGIITYLISQSPLTLFIGTAFIGIGNGIVEAACNPLVTSLYSDKKTTMLNRFHVWFPGGIVIGGIVSFVLISQLQFNWRWLISILFIPALIYGYMIFKLDFPSIASEFSDKKETIRKRFSAITSPLFITMTICMLFSAATELGTNQWLDALLQGVGVSGILILVFINSIMAVGRWFAGPIVDRFNPNGMLIFSAATSAVGLILLSLSEGVFLFASAFIFALGICFFWPTMLGFVSEYLPKTGALGLSLMGGIGMLSVSFILPAIGKIYDNFKEEVISTNGGIDTPSVVSLAERSAGSSVLLCLSVLPIILLAAFIIIFFLRKKNITNSAS